MAEAEVLSQDRNYVVLDERSADLLADRLAKRFHAIAQKLKGGTLAGGPEGQPGPNPKVQNQWGGKGIIKWSPTPNDVVAGIRQQQSLLVWQSPDGLPHFVTIEVGRIAGVVGGPGADGAKGGLIVVSPVSAQGQGSVGGGTWPAAQDSTGNPLYYRAVAQVVLGTPGTMEDPFWIDINRGQRFTALASYVAITAQMNGPPIDELTGNVITPANFTAPFVSGSLAAYATLGMAVAPSLAPVLYTQYIDTTVNAAGIGGAGANFQYIRTVPPRANFLLPILSGNATDKMTLSLFDNTAVLLSQTANNGALAGPTLLAATASNPILAPIAIPADCYGVVVTSKGGFAVNYRLIYQLSV